MRRFVWYAIICREWPRFVSEDQMCFISYHILVIHHCMFLFHLTPFAFKTLISFMHSLYISQNYDGIYTQHTVTFFLSYVNSLQFSQYVCIVSTHFFFSAQTWSTFILVNFIREEQISCRGIFTILNSRHFSACMMYLIHQHDQILMASMTFLLLFNVHYCRVEQYGYLCL